MFTTTDFLSTFGCCEMELEIRNEVNKALANRELPDFSSYNDPENGKCSCLTSDCTWSEESILKRLKDKGIWDKILEYLK